MLRSSAFCLPLCFVIRAQVQRSKMLSSVLIYAEITARTGWRCHTCGDFFLVWPYYAKFCKKINKNMHKTVIKTWVVYYLTFKFFLLSGFSVHPFHIQLLLDARFRPHFDISAHLKHLPFVLSPQDCVFISQSFWFFLKNLVSLLSSVFLGSQTWFSSLY